MGLDILRTLLTMILVWGINLAWKDADSRRHYKNTLQNHPSREVFDSLTFHKYDSLIITYDR